MLNHLLILEDDRNLAESLKQGLEDHGFTVTCAFKNSEIPNSPFSHALLDLRLAGDFGLNAIEKILSQSPKCCIVILTGYGSITTAVEALKKGASDYLTKPASIEQILEALSGNRKVEESHFKTPTLNQMESEYIDFVLTKNKGNISQTAKDIGIHRQSLQRKLRKYT